MAEFCDKSVLNIFASQNNLVIYLFLFVFFFRYYFSYLFISFCRLCLLASFHMCSNFFKVQPES